MMTNHLQSMIYASAFGPLINAGAMTLRSLLQKRLALLFSRL
jgi:hypothetical protein